jgi:predicted  nucleic acid-binding Zn-ribbon protein
MGMFDHYQPDPPLQCPHCGASLQHWQGKDASCALFLWVQGRAAPADQLVDEEIQADASVRERDRLPERFEIYTTCSKCSRWIDATGFTKNGVWSECAFGRHGSSASVRATLLRPGWRQCGRCADAWEDQSSSSFSECPSCKSLTELDELSRVSLTKEAG